MRSPSGLVLLGLFAIQTSVKAVSFGQIPLVHRPQLVEVESPTKSPKTLFTLHRELVEYESISNNEHGVGEYLVSYLNSQGLSTQIQLLPDLPPDMVTSSADLANEAKKKTGRFNVYASFASSASSSRPRVILSSHIDTVPPFYPYNTSTAKLGPETLISGRGSVDAKASVAAQIVAVLDLVRDHAVSKEDLALLFVVGEEVGGDGMLHFSSSSLARDISDDYKQLPSVIFGEPTDAKLACGHKGILQVKITAHGKAAHSGYPWLGVSANDILVKGLAAIQKLAEEGGLPSSEKYGDTTVNIGLIQGGAARNVVAEKATAGLGIRIADGGPDAVFKLLTEAVEAAAKPLIEKGGRVEFERDQGQGYAPVDIDCEGPEGFDTQTVNYGTDVPNLTFKGKSYRRYLYGPGTIQVAHSDHEMLKAKELQQAVDDYKKIIEYELK